MYANLKIYFFLLVLKSKMLTHQITSQFLNAFLLFNAIGFGINFTWAFSQNIDLFSRSLFFTGFNLCILLSDVIYLSAIVVNTKILAVCKKHQLKTLEEKNREDLEAHNESLAESVDKSLEKDSDDELVKELEELDEALEKDDDKNCARNRDSEESVEETVKHNTEESNEVAVNNEVGDSDSDCDSDSSSEEIDQLKIKNFTTRIASLGVKQIDDVLSPEEYENLNFDSL